MAKDRRISPHPKNLEVIRAWQGGKRGGLYTRIEQLDGPPFAYRHVLVGLLKHCQHSGQGGVFPSIDRLAKECGLGRATVVRAMRYWKLQGVIRTLPKRPRPVKSGWNPNEYELGVSPFTLSTEDLLRRKSEDFIEERINDRLNERIIEGSKVIHKGLLPPSGEVKGTEGEPERTPNVPEHTQEGVFGRSSEGTDRQPDLGSDVQRHSGEPPPVPPPPSSDAEIRELWDVYCDELTQQGVTPPRVMNTEDRRNILALLERYGLDKAMLIIWKGMGDWDVLRADKAWIDQKPTLRGIKFMMDVIHGFGNKPIEHAGMRAKMDGPCWCGSIVGSCEGIKVGDPIMQFEVEPGDIRHCHPKCREQYEAMIEEGSERESKRLAELNSGEEAP